MNTISMFSENYFSNILVSNDSRVGTPVPIPNTEVKHSNADDSVCENRKLLTIFFVYKRLFLNDESFFVMIYIV